jgi:integrase
MIEKRRTRSGGSRYEVRLRGVDGKERSRTFRTRKEAERYERAQQTALDQGLWVDPRSGRVTLGTWTAEWQRTIVHLRPTTQRIYDANLRNHVLPELGDVALGKLTPSMLRAWLAGLTTKVGSHGHPLALGSVAQAYRALNRVLSAAVDNELLGRNPLRGVKSPRVEDKAMRFLSHEEVATLASVIDPRYRALVLVAAYSGLRSGEMMALRRQNVDLLRRTIAVLEQVQYISGRNLVSAPKSSASRRSVSLPGIVVSDLETHLVAYAEPGADGLVFPAPEGGYLRRENFRKRVWGPAVLAAGVAPLRPSRSPPHVCIAGNRCRRGRQGAAAHARPHFRCAHPRPVRPPAAWSGGECGGPSRRDGAPSDTHNQRARHSDRSGRGILAGSSFD